MKEIIEKLKVGIKGKITADSKELLHIRRRREERNPVVRCGLRFKFMLFFACLQLVITVVIASFLLVSYDRMVKEQRLDYAGAVLQIVESVAEEKNMCAADMLQEYAYAKTADDTYYRLMNLMKSMQSNAEFQYLYVVVIKNGEEGVYIFDLKLEGKTCVLEHGRGEYNPLKKNYPGLKTVLEKKRPSSKYDRINYGGEKLKSVYVPILDSEKEVRAFLGIDFRKESMRNENRRPIRGMLLFLAAAMTTAFFVLFGVVQSFVLTPVERLEKYARQISDGKLDGEITVKGHDELSEIAEVFNRMTKSIRSNVEETKALNEAYYRYVPDRILTLLGKKSVKDIKLGDEEDLMLSVFSFQLADFDRRIRKRSTKEMIDEINRALGVSTAVAAEYGGMIESFQNAGFTALFEKSCEAALISAITICQRFHQQETIEKTLKNRPGIGIAYGPVTLGIVGQEKRMAAITVSHCRDTACLLQGIAERYQSRILITEETAERIEGFFANYHSRMLGFLYHSDTGRTERVYDVYDGDEGEEFARKNATKDLFEQGVKDYCLRDFQKARQSFIAVLKLFRRDKAAKEYLYLCDKNLMQKEAEEISVCFAVVE